MYVHFSISAFPSKTEAKLVRFSDDFPLFFHENELLIVPLVLLAVVISTHYSLRKAPKKT
jgi:hypothetical protein